MAIVSHADIEKIISQPQQTALLIRQAKEIGGRLKSSLTTSQIRALFSEVRQIEALWYSGGSQREKAFSRLLLLKPKMAYRAAKESGSSGRGVGELVEVLDPAVDQVAATTKSEEQDVRFQRFVDFFEAILAYHRSAGGR